MMTMTLREAAEFLDVDASTVLAWQQLFGFPRRLALGDGRSAYQYEELLALREALQTSWSVVSAVGRAAGGSPVGRSSFTIAGTQAGRR